MRLPRNGRFPVISYTVWYFSQSPYGLYNNDCVFSYKVNKPEQKLLKGKCSVSEGISGSPGDECHLVLTRLTALGGLAGAGPAG